MGKYEAANKNEVPEKVAKEIGNMARDAQLAILVGLMPILGLVYTWRVVQWYLLRRRYPVLTSNEGGENAELAKTFRSTLPRFWFAVLLWPGAFLFLVIYIALT